MSQISVDRALVDAIFEILPEDWRSFRLLITPPETSEAAPDITLVNPDVAGAEAVPGAEVERLVGELVALLAHENRPWPHISYSGHLGADGEWRMRIVAPLPAEEAPPPLNRTGWRRTCFRFMLEAPQRFAQ